MINIEMTYQNELYNFYIEWYIYNYLVFIIDPLSLCLLLVYCLVLFVVGDNFLVDAFIFILILDFLTIMCVSYILLMLLVFLILTLFSSLDELIYEISDKLLKSLFYRGLLWCISGGSTIVGLLISHGIYFCIILPFVVPLHDYATFVYISYHLSQFQWFSVQHEDDGKFVSMITQNNKK